MLICDLMVGIHSNQSNQSNQSNWGAVDAVVKSMHQTMVLGKDGIDDLSLGRSGVAAMAAWLSSQYGDLSSNPEGQV